MFMQPAQMEALDRFTTDIERLAGEQRELSKASTQAKKAAGRADAAVAKLHKRIADLEEQRQVRHDQRRRRMNQRSIMWQVHAVTLWTAPYAVLRTLALLQASWVCNPYPTIGYVALA